MKGVERMAEARHISDCLPAWLERELVRVRAAAALESAAKIGAARQGSSEPRAAEGVHAASLTDAEEEGTSGETVNDVPVYIAPRTGKRASTPTRREISGTSVGEPNEKVAGKDGDLARPSLTGGQTEGETLCPTSTIASRGKRAVPAKQGFPRSPARFPMLVVIDGGLHHAPPSVARSGELDMPARQWGPGPA